MPIYRGSSAFNNANNYSRNAHKKNNWDSSLGLVIENQSSYELEHCNSGYIAGYSLDTADSMFERNSSHGRLVIPSGSVSAQIWRLHAGGNFGKWVGDIFSLGIAASGEQTHVCAYFSLKIRLPGKNHVVACAFTQGRNRCNKAGIQIRGEDGVLDGNGNISGHGTDPTGAVTDMAELSKMVAHSRTFKRDGEEWHRFAEESRMLRVECEFNNEWESRIRFIFKDGEVKMPK